MTSRTNLIFGIQQVSCWFWFIVSIGFMYQISTKTTTVTATITVVNTNVKYPTKHPDTITVTNGKILSSKYEYMARLQYIPTNTPLCPGHNHSDNHTQYTITPSSDGIPIALLVSGSRSSSSSSSHEGGYYHDCSIREKAMFALNQVYPKNMVRYLLIDNDNTSPLSFGNVSSFEGITKTHPTYSSSSTITTAAPTRKYSKQFSIVSTSIIPVVTMFQKIIMKPIHDWVYRKMSTTTSDSSSSSSSTRHATELQWDRPYDHLNPFELNNNENSNSNIIIIKGSDDDDNEILPIYLIDISSHTYYELLSTLLIESTDDTRAGGTRINLDSRTCTNCNSIFHFDSDSSILWISFLAMLSAVVCLLLICIYQLESSHEDELIMAQQVQHQQQLAAAAAARRAAARRRLTREQVTELLPIYRYTGTNELKLIMQQPTTTTTTKTIPSKQKHSQQDVNEESISNAPVVVESTPATEPEIEVEPTVVASSSTSSSSQTENGVDEQHNTVVIPNSLLPPAPELFIDMDHNNVCSICLEEYVIHDKIRVLPNCSHTFHSRCIGKWLLERSSTCPLCKDDLYIIMNDPNAEPTTTDDVVPEEQQNEQNGDPNQNVRTFWNRFFQNFIGSEDNPSTTTDLTEPLLVHNNNQNNEHGIIITSDIENAATTVQNPNNDVIDPTVDTLSATISNNDTQPLHNHHQQQQASSSSWRPNIRRFFGRRVGHTNLNHDSQQDEQQIATTTSLERNEDQNTIETTSIVGNHPHHSNNNDLAEPLLESLTTSSSVPVSSHEQFFC